MVAVAIIEAIARQRLQRGDMRNHIVAQERSEHQLGDLVDIWYDPPNKDILGLRGPAQVASVNFGEGKVTVRSQGRTLDRRHQEVRLHVLYLVYLLARINSRQQGWSVMRMEVENLTSSFVIVGAVFQPGGWHSPQRPSHK